MSLDPVVRDPRLLAEVAAAPHPLLFATISGAHLYGFASPDSDFDLRGVHVLPLAEVLRLEPKGETLERTHVRDCAEIDLVTHDARKFFRLLLRKNGYVLEQLCSPLVVATTPFHAELLSLVPQLVTRHHAHHYRGFADTQWRLFTKESPRRVKPLLYVFRVLRTGIHLLRTGRIEANLERLDEEQRVPGVRDLIARKRAGAEQQTLTAADFADHERERLRLREQFEAAAAASTLPELPSAAAALDDLLVRLRREMG